MEARLFEEINAEMDKSHVQHYISYLHGSLQAGETVLLDQECLLTANLCSNVAKIIRKQESPFSGFIVNFYVFPRPNGIEVPCLPVPWKRTYVGFPTQEVIQSQYVFAVPGGRLQALVYCINKDDIILGRKAFCIRMLDCFFVPV
jgi:hypothetical protein